MRSEFNKDYYKKIFEELPRNTLELFAIRNAWRALIFRYNDLKEYRHNDFFIAMINALLLSSYLQYKKDVDDSCKDAYIQAVCEIHDFEYHYETVYDYAYAAYAVYAASYIRDNDAINTIANATCEAFEFSENNRNDSYKFLIKNDLKLAIDGELSIETPLFPKGQQDEIDGFLSIFSKINTSLEFYVSFIERRIYSSPLNIDDNKLFQSFINTPVERHEQGLSAVFHHIKDDFEGQLSKKVNIGRVIFIGPGGAGKTSLIKALNKIQIEEGKEEPTPGISTSKWKWGNDCDIDILFWDFAGQVMNHSMHKFFLRERCLYILILTTRDDYELENQVEYWLEHIRLYGNNSKVIVVGNKIDSDSQIVDFNERDLKEKYGNIIDFKKISVLKFEDETAVNGSTFKGKFDEFKNLFVQSLKDVLVTHKNELTEIQNSVKEEVLNLTHDFISPSKFNEICLEKGVVGEYEIRSLKEFFNNLGIFVYFPEFHDEALLNPEWLSYGVYKVLRLAENNERKGWISKKQIRDELQKGCKIDQRKLEYPVGKINSITIACILKFKLGYEITENGTEYLVLPSVLAKSSPEHGFRKESALLHFIFDFELLLSPYILHSFISRSSKEIEKSYVWQKGVILHDKFAEALVENTRDKKIDVYIKIKKENTKDENNKRAVTQYLDKLIDRLGELISSEEMNERPKYDELIEIPKDYFSTDNSKSRIISYKILKDQRADNEKYGRTENGKFNINDFWGDYPMGLDKKMTINADTVNIVDGDQKIIAGSNYESKGKQNIAGGDINHTKSEVIHKLIPLLSDLVKDINKHDEFKDELDKLKSFVYDLKESPNDIEEEDVVKIQEQLKSPLFNSKLSSLAITADVIAIGTFLGNLAAAFVNGG